jgi:hypothetical protein
MPPDNNVVNDQPSECKKIGVKRSRAVGRGVAFSDTRRKESEDIIFGHRRTYVVDVISPLIQLGSRALVAGALSVAEHSCSSCIQY